MTTVDSFEFEGIKYFQFGYSPFGRPSLLVYVYFIDGLLIDTGQRNAWKTIRQTISGLDIQQVFVTHHHEDHSGNVHYLNDLFGCPTYASARCCEMMKAPPPISLPQKTVWGSRPPFSGLTPIADEIRTTNHTFQMVPIPGHAEDMVALYEPQRQWLFSADLYVNSYIGYFLPEESITQQIQSIKKILELEFKVLLCGHNPQLTNGRQKLEKKLHFLEDFYDQVCSWCQKGLSAKEIFKAMNLKEHGIVYMLSNGRLSKLNMVKSAMRDYTTT